MSIGAASRHVPTLISVEEPALCSPWRPLMRAAEGPQELWSHAPNIVIVIYTPIVPHKDVCNHSGFSIFQEGVCLVGPLTTQILLQEVHVSDLRRLCCCLEVSIATRAKFP